MGMMDEFYDPRETPSMAADPQFCAVKDKTSALFLAGMKKHEIQEETRIYFGPVFGCIGADHEHSSRRTYDVRGHPDGSGKPKKCAGVPEQSSASRR